MARQAPCLPRVPAFDNGRNLEIIVGLFLLNPLQSLLLRINTQWKATGGRGEDSILD